MTTFRTLDTGWSAGHLAYGAGLIKRTTSGTQDLTVNSTPGDWGWDIGHGGMTYGFSTSQGYLPSLRFAYSVAANVDDWDPANFMTCLLHEIAIEVLSGATVNLGCYPGCCPSGDWQDPTKMPFRRLAR